MHRCLELASAARGKTGVNPLVGAVLVRDGLIVAEGYHRQFGKEHAELDLLQKFDQNIYSTDELYVSLEPCCHQHKKTPPCTELLLERGICNVYYGMKDPNPLVLGKGIKFLNKNNIQTFGPILEQKCKRLLRGYTSVMTNNRPWITLKSAQTLNGRFAHDDGSPLRITSEAQNSWSHEYLRARHDAILVGVETICRDDPQLTVRSIKNPPLLWKIILDPHLRIPLSSRVLSADSAQRTIVVTALEKATISNDREKKINELCEKGVMILPVSVSNDEFNLQELLMKIIKPDGDFYGISSILVEGGERTWTSFRSSSCVDEEVVLVG